MRHRFRTGATRDRELFESMVVTTYEALGLIRPRIRDNFLQHHLEGKS